MIVAFDTKEGLVFRATPKAVTVRRSVKAKILGDVLFGAERAVGAASNPEPEIGDRSLGRLPGLEPEDLETAIKEHGGSVRRRTGPLIAAARALIKRQNRKS